MPRNGRHRTPGKKYGAQHQALRKRAMASYLPGVTICWRCHKPITEPPSQVHLGHSDDGTRYMGLEHRRCNLSAQMHYRAEMAKVGKAALAGEAVNGSRPRREPAQVPVPAGPWWRLDCSSPGRPCNHPGREHQDGRCW